MQALGNERGAVLVFVTLMIVLLLIMVGMGLDTGHLAYIRSQGQPAVDAAALAAASAIPTGDLSQVHYRAAAFNSTNTYLDSSNNLIGASNVTLVKYDPVTQDIDKAGNMSEANGVRVAMERSNPYGGTVGSPMKSPLFLAPLLKLFGQDVKSTADVSVSAVAVIRAAPDLPIAVEELQCGGSTPKKLLQSSTKTDTSGYTTFHIHNASKTQINNLLTASFSCSGGIPAVGVGYCTHLNNGQIASLYDEFQKLFESDKGRCYLIPVVATGVSYTGCSPIKDFARFCPVEGDDGFGLGRTKSADGQGWDRYIYGTVNCGQNPYNVTDMKCQIPALVRDIPSGM